MGASVIVVEKGGCVGQHRSMTSGWNSKVQQEAGMEFTRDMRTEAILDMYEASQRYQSKTTLVSKYIDRSGEYIDFVAEAFKEYGVATVAGGFQIPGVPQDQWHIERDSSTMGTYSPLWNLAHVWGQTFEVGENFNWMKTMERYCLDRGVEFDFNTCGKRLEREGADNKSGRCTALIAQNEKGEYVRYKAKKAVILAAGDFMADPEMIERYCPVAAKNVFDFWNHNCTGDMHKAAMWVGARMDAAATPDCWPNATITGKNLKPKDNPFYVPFMNWSYSPAYSNAPHLYVDTTTGKRFINEETEYGVGCMKLAVAQASASSKGYCYVVFDGAVAEKWAGLIPEMEPFSYSTPDQLALDVEEGVTFKADTLEELAKLMEVPPENLVATVERYNGFCEAGYDDDCVKNPAFLKTVDTAPYYAVPVGMSIECVRGGIVTDDDLRCVDMDGNSIEGLYAVGNNGGGFYGCFYPPSIAGSGVGHGQCFSYCAAEHACSL